MVIRPVAPGEYEIAGELVVEAYRGLGDVGDEFYERELRDVEGRVATGEVLVAELDGRVVGCVTLAAGQTALSEVDDADAATVRMLAVSPVARGRGIGDALMRSCIDQARTSMGSAQRLYDRLGFRRDPDHDWSPAPGIALLAYVLDLNEPTREPSRGPVVLLSPSFSREDESKFPRALDRLSRVFGHLPYSLMLRVIGPAMKSSLPPGRRDVLIAELRNNDPRFLRRQTRGYLAYLDRYGSLASCLGDAGVRTRVVFGERDDVGLTQDEREVLAEYADVKVVEIPGVGHFTLNQDPGRIEELILDAIGSPETES